MKKLRIVHPLMFSIFPVLSLYGHNTEDIPILHIARPLSIVLLCGALLWLVVGRLVKNHDKAAIIVSAFIFYFSCLNPFLFHYIKAQELGVPLAGLEF